MNKEEIAYAISQKNNITFIDANKTLDVMLNIVSNELANGNKVKFKYFGTFEAVKRAPRKGFNPYYRKEVVIPACLEPVFKPSDELKNKIKEIPD